MLSIQLQKHENSEMDYSKKQNIYFLKLMKTIKQFTFYILLLFAATSCIEDFTIRGNGIAVTQVRQVPSFDKVISSGSFDVHITKGDELEVVLNAEENILPYIETSVSNNTLLIDIRGMHNVKNRLPMNMYITIPELLSVKQSESDNITTDYFTADRMEFFISGSGSISTTVDANVLDASISGSGWMIIDGDANQSNLAISGSGNIDCSNLTVNNCNANISGSGNMQVKAVKTIYAKISGSGNIYYTGNPGLELNISGSGKVIPVN